MHLRKSGLLVFVGALVWMSFLSQSVLAAEGKKKLEIQSGIFGGVLYQVSYAFSVIGNKYAQDLEFSTVETTGSAAGIIKAYEQPEGRIVAATYVPILGAREGQPPFDKPYPDMRVIGNFTKNIQTFITLDDSIKSIEDLKGKRLGLGPKPTVIGKNMESMIRHGYGISKKMKIYYMKWPQLKDAILDGSIHAMVLGVTIRPSGPWAPVPVYKEIASARKNVSFLPIPEEAVKKAAAADKISYPAAILPKDAIAPGQPDKDIPCWSENLALFAHKDLDPAIAYQLAEILYTHCGEMAKTTAIAKGTWPGVVADISLSDDMIHPGALKFYKEKGLR